MFLEKECSVRFSPHPGGGRNRDKATRATQRVDDKCVCVSGVRGFWCEITYEEAREHGEGWEMQWEVQRRKTRPARSRGTPGEGAKPYTETADEQTNAGMLGV